MNNELEEIKNMLDSINSRLDQIEFKQDRLFYRTNVDSILYEYNVTRKQYEAIMDEMDKIRETLEEGKSIENSGFERHIEKIMNNRQDIDYHFCEYIARAFMEDDRWEEVFPALYGNMPKYKHLLENDNE